MRLGVVGANGKMGKRVVALAKQDSTFSSVIPIPRSLEGLKNVEVLIDFSSPELTPLLLEEAVRMKKPLVVGTTGHSETERLLLKEASQLIPLLHAPNFSLGVQLSQQLIAQATSFLGDAFKIEIKEIHHIHKKDAPSGTALAWAAATQKNPSISSIREGEVFGIHEIRFISPEEEITLTHQAFSRDLFAKGALLAAQKLFHSPPGFYTLLDLAIKERSGDDRRHEKRSN
jgi:4-hydroxy-tetrahydrodipicolinate reductase